jgi:hypothetical protein
MFSRCGERTRQNSRPRRRFAISIERVKPRIVLVVGAALISLVCLSACQTARPKPQAAVKATKTSPAAAPYIKSMEDRLGQVWYQLVRIHETDLYLGRVDTTFEIPAAGGKVRNVKVISNTGGRMDPLIALRAIEQLRAPPIPPQVLAELHQDYIEVEESFTVFPSR